jgi:hypothetical protein
MKFRLEGFQYDNFCKLRSYIFSNILNILPFRLQEQSPSYMSASATARPSPGPPLSIELNLPSYYNSHTYREWTDHRTKRHLYNFQLWLITGPKFIMLLIILLGIITKLAVISADCDTDTVNRNVTDWSTVSYSLKSRHLMYLTWMWENKIH